MSGFHQCINAVSLALVIAFGTAIIVKPEPTSLVALGLTLASVGINKLLDLFPSNKARIDELQGEIAMLHTSLRKLNEERGLDFDDFSH